MGKSHITNVLERAICHMAPKCTYSAMLVGEFILVKNPKISNTAHKSHAIDVIIDNWADLIDNEG